MAKYGRMTETLTRHCVYIDDGCIREIIASFNSPERATEYIELLERRTKSIEVIGKVRQNNGQTQ